MKLPFRIAHATSERVISVDGVFDAPGLNLSHWPGQRTPSALRHDLSTGIALAFMRLPESERAELARGCCAIVNNHYDTDGTCAAFALLEPELALAHERVLLEAAAAGDFFRAPSEQAVAIDALISALADRERSPLAREFVGLADDERYGHASRYAFEILPRLLAGELEPWRELWAPAVAALARGRTSLARATQDELVHLDWVIWTLANAEHELPGRHALFGSSNCDRVLVCAPRQRGTHYRFLLSSLSWFELASAPKLARPDLEALALRLDELEGSRGSPQHWRTQPTNSPSPELWFGDEGLSFYAEHNAALAPSRLAPALVKREISDALRRALILPV